MLFKKELTVNQATNEPTISLTDALALHGIGLSAANANKVLQGAGMTETRWRNSSVAGRPQKSFRAATPLGESMGIINEAATLPTGDPVIIKYAPSKFAELWAHQEVAATLRVLLSEGAIAMKSASAKQEIF
jgi:hypothetical protein